MGLRNSVEKIAFGPGQRLKMTYAQLQQCGIDMGFTSVIKYGRDFHQLTRDICLSFMKFHDLHLTNLLFANGHPIHLDFDEQEIISYYSDYIELRYIVEGSVELEIEGEMLRFNEGEFCFINSMAYHRESIHRSDGLLLNVSVRRDVFTDAMLNSVSGTPLQKFLRQNILQKGEQQHVLRFSAPGGQVNESAQDYLYHIMEELINQQAGYMEISKGYIIRLMDYLSITCRQELSRSESEEYTQKLFESVSLYIQENLQDITMADLTGQFHFQANYFNNLIKKKTGMTYSDYLIHLRILRAKQLLTDSAFNIEEIMWLVGYNNKGFFYRKFKESTGMSPSRYRTVSKKEQSDQ